MGWGRRLLCDNGVSSRSPITKLLRNIPALFCLQPLRRLPSFRENWENATFGVLQWQHEA